MATSFVRCFMEQGQFFRHNVYKVERNDSTVTLTPIFGKFKDSFTIPAIDFAGYYEDDNLIPVQAMQRISDGSLHFFHITQDRTVCWVNAETSGTMPSLDFWNFMTVEL